jgi:CDP-paratose 2-epimerase
VDLSFSDWRPGDQRYYVSDPSAARRELGLPEAIDWRTGVAGLAQWLTGERREVGDSPREQVAAVG